MRVSARREREEPAVVFPAHRRIVSDGFGGRKHGPAARLENGGEDFADWLAEKLDRVGRPGERARERRETDEALAKRLVQMGLKEAGWSAADLK